MRLRRVEGMGKKTRNDDQEVESRKEIVASKDLLTKKIMSAEYNEKLIGVLR